MAKFSKLILIGMMFITLMGCSKDDVYGDVILKFRGHSSNFKVGIYPIHMDMDNVLSTMGLYSELKPDENGEIRLTNMLQGDYFWYDYYTQRGVFQVIGGKTLTFNYSRWTTPAIISNSSDDIL